MYVIRALYRTGIRYFLNNLDGGLNTAFGTRWRFQCLRNNDPIGYFLYHLNLKSQYVYIMKFTSIKRHDN